MANRKALRVVLVNHRHIRILTWEVPEGFDLSYANVIRYENRLYTYHHIDHGEFAVEFHEVDILDIPVDP